MLTLSRVKDLISGAALMVIGVGTLLATAEFSTDAEFGNDPALLPRFIAVGLILCGLTMCAVDFARRRMGADNAEDTPDGELRADDATPIGTELRVTTGLAVALLVYAIAAFQLGYFTSTLAFVIVGGLILGRSRNVRSVRGLAIFAIAVALVAYIGFFELLGVRSPDSLLP